MFANVIFVLFYLYYCICICIQYIIITRVISETIINKITIKIIYKQNKLLSWSTK